MKISDHDLRQLDAANIHRVVMEQPQAVEPLMIRLVEALKEARERLNQPPGNSSRPPSTRDPWLREDVSPPEGQAKSGPTAATSADIPSPKPLPAKASGSEASRAPGRQPGSPGQRGRASTARRFDNTRSPC